MEIKFWYISHIKFILLLFYILQGWKADPVVWHKMIKNIKKQMCNRYLEFIKWSKSDMIVQRKCPQVVWKFPVTPVQIKFTHFNILRRVFEKLQKFRTKMIRFNSVLGSLAVDCGGLAPVYKQKFKYRLSEK